MQRTSYTFRLILGLSLSLAITLPVIGQDAGTTPQAATPTQAPATAQPAAPVKAESPMQVPGTTPSTKPSSAVEGVGPAPVKVTNEIEPVVSLEHPMANSAFSFEEVRKAPIIGTPAFFQRAFGRPDTRVELRGPVGFAEYVRDGTLHLTLRSYLDLVLANNTSIALQKVLLETPKNAIQRAMSFLDPTFNAGFTPTRSTSPAASTLEGASIVSNLNQQSNLGYSQAFLPGTQVNLNSNVSRSSSNNSFLTFNPSLRTGFEIAVTQPLLRNRGVYINKLPISIARNNLQVSQRQFEDQVIQLLTQAEGSYWDYLEARENLRVQEAALALRDASLKRAQRELELGAIPELDIFQPQADFAQAEVNYTQAKFRVARTEDVLRQQMAVDLEPGVRNLPIEISDPVNMPPPAVEFDREAVVEMALRTRPDLLQQRQQLVGDDMSVYQSINTLRPNLALTLRYSGAGLGGNTIDRDTGLILARSGLWNAYGDSLAFNFPTYAMTLQLQLPLRDRQASANYADSIVRKKSTMLRIRNQEQSVRLDVLNALNNLEASRESVRLAALARDFAQKRLEAEQKKYDLGTVTLFFLQTAQTDLISANQRMVTESINYNRNHLQLLRLTGTLLDERGVVLR